MRSASTGMALAFSQSNALSASGEAAAGQSSGVRMPSAAGAGAGDGLAVGAMGRSFLEWRGGEELCIRSWEESDHACVAV
jgi:hypothetical protein